MGREIRTLLTISYGANGKLWYKNSESNVQELRFIMQSGQSTMMLETNGTDILAHATLDRNTKAMKKCLLSLKVIKEKWSYEGKIT